MNIHKKNLLFTIVHLFIDIFTTTDIELYLYLKEYSMKIYRLIFAISFSGSRQKMHKSID